MAKRDKYQEWLEPDNLIKLKGWARDGLTDAQIAHNMGISHNTLISWKKKLPEFAQALKITKDVVDKEVENALYKRAMGFEYTETVEERKLNPETGQFEMVVTKRVNKVALPDTTAQIFWLKNRKPDVWRDKREIESTEAIDKLDGILTGIKEAAKLQADTSENGPV